MVTMPEVNRASPGTEERTATRDDEIAIDEKKIASNAPDNTDVGVVEEEPQKTYYSSLSVWLMVLFSGLAIGSDG